MTRKHFQAIANTLADTLPADPADRAVHAKLANALADTLADTNPRFDRARFLAAASVAAADLQQPRAR